MAINDKALEIQRNMATTFIIRRKLLFEYQNTIISSKYHIIIITRYMVI